MNDPNSFGYQDMTGGAPGPGSPPTAGSPNMAQYKFSPDEMRVLQECNRESFFQRSLPFGTVFGLATGAAVQQGYLKGNARFGALPKVTLAVVAGYFLGKLSYQRACADKLMALPGSYIGQLLRDRRDNKGGKGPAGAAAGGGGAAMLGATPGDIYSDAGPGSALDLDSDRAGHVFSEDLTRPEHTNEGGGGGAEGAGAGARAAARSYDELRRLNRGEHADSKQDPYRLPAPAPTGPLPARRASPAPPTNAYGDVME